MSVQSRRAWTASPPRSTHSGCVQTIFLLRDEREELDRVAEEKRSKPPMGFGPQKPR